MEHLHFGSGRARLGPNGRPVFEQIWADLSVALANSLSSRPLV